MAVAVSTLLAATAAAGSLNPPAAPGPTMKTLDEVEPRIPIHSADIPMTITQPGSYYLAENINFNTPARTAISLNTANVVIDLNGFNLKGPGALTSAIGDGIHFNIQSSGTVVIKDGTVTGWGNDGIDMVAAGDVDIRVTNVTSAYNRTYGISMRNGKVSNCTLTDNGIAGVILYSGQCSNNIFKDGNFGVVTTGDTGGLISDNLFQGQTSYAIRVNSGNFRIDHNTITGPGSGTGIYVGASSSLVTRNMVTNHTTPYNLHATCTAGPILNLQGGTLTSENPWANFK